MCAALKSSIIAKLDTLIDAQIENVRNLDAETETKKDVTKLMATYKSKAPEALSLIFARFETLCEDCVSSGIVAAGFTLQKVKLKAFEMGVRPEIYIKPFKSLEWSSVDFTQNVRNEHKWIFAVDTYRSDTFNQFLESASLIKTRIDQCENKKLQDAANSRLGKSLKAIEACFEKYNSNKKMMSAFERADCNKTNFDNWKNSLKSSIEKAFLSLYGTVFMISPLDAPPPPPYSNTA